ncbi:MAG: helix-turn-helix domain-containing protein [Donghicola eburneus]|nr:helix-turn-helix transcriptional regulator [Donghicola eburneus]MCI5042806.1 helix-turn-helix domain-containing protein [Donghicola eburneus]
MSYAIEEFSEQLRAAREKKGLSQRELSALAGVPQSHISKIENSGVDLRISSLAAIARALDLELTLVPRKALPAVKSVSRSVTQSTISSPEVQLEFDHLAKAIKAASAAVQSPALQNIHRRLRELKLVQPQIIDPEVLRKIRRTFEQVEKSGSLSAAENAAKQLSSLRNRIVYSSPEQTSLEAPRPAYRLEDDDD